MMNTFNTWKAEHPKTCHFCEVARDIAIMLGAIFSPVILSLIGHYSYYWRTKSKLFGNIRGLISINILDLLIIRSLC